MTTFAGNNAFNPLPVIAQPHSGRKKFSTLQSNTFKTSKSHKRTSFSATEQMEIVLYSAVLGQKLLTRLTYLIVLKGHSAAFSCHHI